MADLQLTPTKILEIAAELIPASVYQNHAANDVLTYYKTTPIEKIANDSLVFGKEEIGKFMNHTIPCMEEKIEEANQFNMSDWQLIWQDW